MSSSVGEPARADRLVPPAAELDDPDDPDMALGEERLFPGFRTMTVAVGAQHVRCVVGGHGPPVLLLHGFPESLEMWSAIAAGLSATHTVICSDLRGYGRSSKPEPGVDGAGYTFREMAEDQRELMRILGFGVFDLVGHDRGARVAHRLTLDTPECVRSLALLDIAPTRVLFEAMDYRLAAAYWHWQFLPIGGGYPEKVIEADPDHFFGRFMAGFGNTSLTDFDPVAIRAYRSSWHDPAAIRAMCADYRAALHLDLKIDQTEGDTHLVPPVLILWGDSGPLAKLFDVDTTWGPYSPNLTRGFLPGGHYFPEQSASAAVRALAQFLQSGP